MFLFLFECNAVVHTHHCFQFCFDSAGAYCDKHVFMMCYFYTSPKMSGQRILFDCLSVNDYTV